MKNLEVPFYPNTPDDTHCFQAVLKMALKFFLPERDFSWEELDKITAKVDGLWTWSSAGLLWLKNNGFEVIDIEAFDYSRFVKEKGQYLISMFGREIGETQIKYSELNQEVVYAKELLEKVNPELRIPDFQEIRNFLNKDYLVICNINAHALYSENGYSGHFVLIKGFSEDTLILHDPGSPPNENKEVTLSVFERAWGYPEENAKNIIALKLRRESVAKSS